MNQKLELSLMLPKKTHCPSEEYDAGRNRGINASLTALEKRVATTEELMSALDNSFDCWACIRRRRFAQALQEKFVILRKGEK